jgi:hypothetical protein
MFLLVLLVLLVVLATNFLTPCQNFSAIVSKPK